MKILPRQKTILILVVVIFSGLIAQAQPWLDGIGANVLRAVTTNLNGAGVRVAEIEAPYGDVTNFEANPVAIGQSANLITYISSAGSATNYPNSVGGYSDHANTTAYVICSPIYSGVATNIGHLDNIEANYFLANDLISLANINDPVANQSFINSNPDYSHLPVSEEQTSDSQYDNYAAQTGTLFISAAGDGGPTNQARVYPPATCYNGIGVAAYYPPGAYSSIGPTLDNGRCKPDITAINVFTSFSTPQVTGAAALLMQAGLRGDGGGNTNVVVDMRTIKALLLNGAVKPLGWTNSNSSPLDARYGAGVLNVLNSYEQLAGGRQSNLVFTTVSAGNAHPPVASTNAIAVLSGWDFGTNTSSAASDAIKHYYFNVSNNVSGARFTATATLVWNRHQNKTAINNLNLFLYNCANSNLVACSTSLVDNVEHIYKTNLVAGRYDLQVWKAGGTVVTTNEAYALAFEFFSPSLNLAPAGVNPALTWPVYPAGFLVETATNLLAPVWTTNNLPPASVTNGSNYILLEATNANQFFRLRRPNL